MVLFSTEQTWSGTRFVAVGGTWSWSPSESTFDAAPVVVHSTDGITWTDASGAGALDDASYLSGVTWGGGRFVAVGTGSDIIDTNTGEESPRGAMILHSTDGATWTAVSHARALAGSLRGVTWGGTRFVAVGESADGWTILTSP